MILIFSPLIAGLLFNALFLFTYSLLARYNILKVHEVFVSHISPFLSVMAMVLYQQYGYSYPLDHHSVTIFLDIPIFIILASSLYFLAWQGTQSVIVRLKGKKMQYSKV